MTYMLCFILWSPNKRVWLQVIHRLYRSAGCAALLQHKFHRSTYLQNAIDWMLLMLWLFLRLWVKCCTTFLLSPQFSSVFNISLFCYRFLSCSPCNYYSANKWNWGLGGWCWFCWLQDVVFIFIQEHEHWSCWMVLSSFGLGILIWCVVELVSQT